MARGWESKSVEAQQEEAKDRKSPAKPRLSAAEISKVKEKEGLLLSRQRILQQLSAAHNSRHQQVLQAALVDLDAKIAALEDKDRRGD